MSENIDIEFSSGLREELEVGSNVEEKTQTRFNKLERAALLSALEECTNTLAVFRQTHHEPASHIDMDISCVPVEVRVSEPVRTHLFGHDASIGMKDIESQAAFRKLQNDSAHAEGILESTRQELRESGCSTILARVTKELMTKQKMEETLLKDYEETVAGVKRIRQTIAEEVESNSNEKKQYQRMLMNIENEMEAIQLKCAAETSYVSAWEKARCEQNAMRCCRAEENLIRALGECAIEEKNEKRVMTELDKYLRQNITHNEKEIASWQCRYLEELKNYNVDIDKLRKGIEARRNVVEKMKEEFFSKQAFIDAYLSEKEAERQQEKYAKHVNSSAISIQCWWRGIMVRRKLGPFRPEERKKKRTAKTKK